MFDKKNFARYAWFVVIFTIGVILWGAVVRATGSGAGCGNNWPDCNGEIIPTPERIETLIEFGHRVSSAASGLLVLIMMVWAFRLKDSSKFLRWMAVMSFIFILIEGGLGASLVRLELVEDNASTLRAVVVAIHLVNTLVLLGFITLTAWAARRDNISYQGKGRVLWGLLIGLLGFAVMSAAGAVTALGDTLFMSGALEQVTDNPAEHFLVQLRVIHPMIAVGVSVYLFALGYYLFSAHDSERVHNRTQQLFIIVAVQIGIGVLNIALKAPVWMQVVHLLIADTMWIVLVTLTADALTLRGDEAKAKVSDGEALSVATS